MKFEDLFKESCDMNADGTFRWRLSKISALLNDNDLKAQLPEIRTRECGSNGRAKETDFVDVEKDVELTAYGVYLLLDNKTSQCISHHVEMQRMFCELIRKDANELKAIAHSTKDGKLFWPMYKIQNLLNITYYLHFNYVSAEQIKAGNANSDDFFEDEKYKECVSSYGAYLILNCLWLPSDGQFGELCATFTTLARKEQHKLYHDSRLELQKTMHAGDETFETVMQQASKELYDGIAFNPCQVMGPKEARLNNLFYYAAKTKLTTPPVKAKTHFKNMVIELAQDSKSKLIGDLPKETTPDVCVIDKKLKK